MYLAHPHTPPRGLLLYPRENGQSVSNQSIMYAYVRTGFKRQNEDKRTCESHRCSETTHIATILAGAVTITGTPHLNIFKRMLPLTRRYRSPSAAQFIASASILVRTGRGGLRSWLSGSDVAIPTLESDNTVIRIQREVLRT
jgi:hypothetical protein